LAAKSSKASDPLQIIKKQKKIEKMLQNDKNQSCIFEFYQLKKLKKNRKKIEKIFESGQFKKKAEEFR
jgi:hypothetical protein